MMMERMSRFEDDEDGLMMHAEEVYILDIWSLRIGQKNSNFVELLVAPGGGGLTFHINMCNLLHV